MAQVIGQVWETYELNQVASRIPKRGEIVCIAKPDNNVIVYMMVGNGASTVQELYNALMAQQVDVIMQRLSTAEYNISVLRQDLTNEVNDKNTKISTLNSRVDIHDTQITQAVAQVNENQASLVAYQGETDLHLNTLDDRVLSLEGRTSTLETSLAAHIARTDNPHGVTKAQVGLGNVDNTSDATKAAAGNAVGDAIIAVNTALTDHKNATTAHTKDQVGLGNVDNTSDAAKPVSTAQEARMLEYYNAALASDLSYYNSAIEYADSLGGDNTTILKRAARLFNFSDVEIEAPSLNFAKTPMHYTSLCDCYSTSWSETANLFKRTGIFREYIRGAYISASLPDGHYYVETRSALPANVEGAVAPMTQIIYGLDGQIWTRYARRSSTWSACACISNDTTQLIEALGTLQNRWETHDGPTLLSITSSFTCTNVVSVVNEDGPFTFIDFTCTATSWGVWSSANERINFLGYYPSQFERRSTLKGLLNQNQYLVAYYGGVIQTINTVLKVYTQSESRGYVPTLLRCIAGDNVSINGYRVMANNVFIDWSTAL